MIFLENLEYPNGFELQGGAAPPGTLPAPTAPTLYLSSTILRKISRSATEEKDSEYFSNYLWLFRTRMPMLRRQDLL
jgi:hypothetical protein